MHISRLVFLLANLGIFSLSGWSQTLSDTASAHHIFECQPQRLATLPSILPESSGLIIYGDNQFISINDSGNTPQLIGFDSTGTVKFIKTIAGAQNRDWEAITEDTLGWLYIMDTGNNAHQRREFQVYKIRRPDSWVESDSLPGETIVFTLPDQPGFDKDRANWNFDFESAVWQNRHLYLFSKNWKEPFDGAIRVYQIPDSSGSYQATFIGVFPFSRGPRYENWITDASRSADGKTLALLSNTKIWLLPFRPRDSLALNEAIEIRLPTLSQREALTLDGRGHIYLTDEKNEFMGGYLYRIDASCYRSVDKKP